MANIIEIHDFSDPALDVYARLTENQLLNRADPDNALFVAESPLVIGRALDAGCEPVSFLMERQHTQGKGREILARCCQDIPVYTADESVLTQLTGFHLTRGMLCAMRRPKLQSVEDVCRDARRVVVLENVMNPTNIGAIFRSAAALGMDAVLLPEFLPAVQLAEQLMLFLLQVFHTDCKTAFPVSVLPRISCNNTWYCFLLLTRIDSEKKIVIDSIP